MLFSVLEDVNNNNKCFPSPSYITSLLLEFLYKYLGIIDASDSESNVHYSLDS